MDEGSRIGSLALPCPRYGGDCACGTATISVGCRATGSRFYGQTDGIPGACVVRRVIAWATFTLATTRQLVRKAVQQ